MRPCLPLPYDFISGVWVLLPGVPAGEDLLRLRDGAFERPGRVVEAGVPGPGRQAPFHVGAVFGEVVGDPFRVVPVDFRPVAPVHPSAELLGLLDEIAYAGVALVAVFRGLLDAVALVPSFPAFPEEFAVCAVCAVVGREALCGDVDAPVAVLGEVFAVPDVPDEPLAGEEPSLGLAHGPVVLFEARDEFFPALGVEAEAVADLFDEYLVFPCQ